MALVPQRRGSGEQFPTVNAGVKQMKGKIWVRGSKHGEKVSRVATLPDGSGRRLDCRQPSRIRNVGLKVAERPV